MLPYESKLWTTLREWDRRFPSVIGGVLSIGCHLQAQAPRDG
jgi:hypothetical protein